MKNIFALDLGTTKFCLGRYDSDKKSFYTSSVEARGMRNGMLYDFDKAKEALSQLIDVAESDINEQICEVVVGVAGSHIGYKTQKVDLSFRKIRNIDFNTIEDLEKKIKEFDKKPIIQKVPISYNLDNRSNLLNPLGLSSSKISAEYFTIHADPSYIKDIIKLINSCGIKIKEIYTEPFASLKSTLIEDETLRGCLLVDIGGGSTDCFMYLHGAPIKIFTINIGGKLFTNDLAIGLGVSTTEAENIKLSNVALDENKNRQMAYIIGMRAEELSYLIKKEIEPYLKHLSAGVFITGGGSQTNHLTSILSKSLGIKVTQKQPSFGNLLKNSEQSFTFKYATLIGLIKLEYSKMLSTEQHSRQSLYNTFINWLKELS